MNKSPIGPARRSRLVGNVALLTLATLGATASCGQTTDPAAGLMLAIQSDGPLPINRLEIRIAGNGKELRRTSYRVPEEATLPTTLAIASNGNARASVEIVVVGWHDEVPLDRRDAIVTQIPADRVALLRVVLSGRCSSRVKVVDDEAVSTCAEGETCSPSSGDCTPADVDAQELDTYQGGDELGLGGAGGEGGGSGGREDGGAAGAPELGDGATGGTLLPSGGTSGDGGHGGVGIPDGPDPLLIGCGDGVIQLDDGEACDDGNNDPGDGCAADCRAIDRGYSCKTSGACQLEVACGDGKLGGIETCDDGNKDPGDGCSATCTRETGFSCYVPGEACAPRCGDGKVMAPETCDDGGTSSGDGCNASCLVEPGFTCTEQGGCVASVCPDGQIDADESCDDNNSAAGDSCSAVCTLEPQVTLGANPSVAELCGDGMATASEGCDDGNITSGDGCSATCKVEDGWACASAQTALPPTLTVPVTFRDFKSASAPGGHPDFQYQALQAVFGIVGAPCTVANQATCGRLNAQGKPSLIVNNQVTTGILNANTFGLWFTDGNPSNVPGYNGVIATTTSFKKPMTLTQLGGTSANVYRTAAGALYPLDGQGFGPISGEVGACAGGVFNYANTCTECAAPCPTHNFGFTSELRHFFQYQGGETLSFLGDDDVWVFVNGRLAVDIGGMHPARYGQVVLGDDGAGVAGQDSNCSLHNGTIQPPNPGSAEVPGCYTTAERAKTTDDRFGLTVGGVYEIVLFQAERHTSASNFQLTLGGFIEPRSVCMPTCGDGVRTSTEACDGGKLNSNTDYLACNTTCSARAVCGDGIHQAAEGCDNGVNDTVYFNGKPTTECSPSCTTPPYCGDGIIDSLFGEECDDGANDNSYAGCSRGCKLTARCGDGTKQQTHETCDDGNRLSGDGCSAGCQRE